MKTPRTEADSRKIFEALAHGVAGDHDTAMTLLLPVLKRDPRSTYATVCSLAEFASFDALQNQKPGEHFGIEVEHIDTGAEGSANDLTPGIRFAAQFVTAWANRDHDTADALYKALHRENPDEFVIGVRALYDMAVVSLRAFCERKRAEGVQ
ncbi:hypothetical protein [Streptomyces caniscabiei]|uniref:hypothetical protein n=1 Tax=Streptomyces caniscabiei TaxID=2746961 RepID=UPI00076617B0|nr:hypothetical protein [Streptomyces caniscabiei]